MFNFLRKSKNRVTTIDQVAFVKNQNFIKVTNRNTLYEKSELHNCTRNVMRLCRWVGLFPVEGLERTSWNKLKFNLKSYYGVYYITIVFGQIMNTIVSLTQILQSGVSLSVITFVLFYLNGVISTMLLFFTSRHWPTLIKRTAALENARGVKINRNTSKKISVLAYMIIAFGVVEHCLSVNYNLKYIKGCHPNYNLNEVIRMFLFTRMPYNIARSDSMNLIFQTYLEVTGKQGTFLWSFTDVISICMSIYLIAHFEKLNKLIFAGKDNKSTNWRKLREQHANLVQLVHLINDHFNYFVLLSCFCNVYFMCVQLYNTLGVVAFYAGRCDRKGIADVLHSFEHHVYFFFSFIFLMFRTLTLSLLAANVNTVAREPLSALGDIHSSVYGIEIQRFYRQINYTTIGVSGVFFYVTRGTILKVIGSLVTYELLLVQINNRKHTSHLPVFDTANVLLENSTLLSLYSNDNFSK